MNAPNDTAHDTLDEANRVQRAFFAINCMFGLAYGCYLYYVFVYLDALLSGAHNPISNLLIVFLATMVFEAIAEPATGDYADLYGRRKSQAIAFLMLGLGFVIYALLTPLHELTHN